ncbi:MAG TPA: DNRLRE domain-containing protein [Gemmatimonadales bacterium]|nr:DNRLRE domain-containing protein [Gemmatimonadales bacterium]
MTGLRRGRLAAATTASAVTATINPTADTYLNINTVNYAADTTLNVYTWPKNKIANAIVMKFDLSAIPAGSAISSATLNLYLSQWDTIDSTYRVTLHKIVNKNPDPGGATGATYDGVNGWTPNACCYNNFPLAQADIGAPVATLDVDHTPAFKQWDVTALIQDWFANPPTNFGLLLNADSTKLADQYRFFRSSEHPVTSTRPYLSVVYTPPAPPPRPPAPSAIPPTQDTYLNIDATNYATDTTLNVYTWPSNKIANAIVMKFDLTQTPPDSTVVGATLNLYLSASDATTDPTYHVTVHPIVNKSPDLTRATGYTYDGVNPWTPNACCYQNIPVAQADIGPAVDGKDIDKTLGFKTWDVTAIVRQWRADPRTNLGLLVNSDPSKLADRYRFFTSSRHPASGTHPYLTITYGPPAPAPGPEATLGQWSAVMPAPIVQVHLHLLPSGKVLSWGRIGDPQVWDPATGTFTAVPAPSWLFCAGHTFLPDGRLFVTGGHISDDHGLPNANVFDPSAGSWQTMPPMAYGRWYPTSTTLPDGEVVTIAGADQNAVSVPIPEVWNGTTWRQLTTASMPLEYYPRSFLAPDGRVFYAGEEQPSRWLDVTGTGSWTPGPARNFSAWRSYGSAVMYEPGKILYAGGGDPPTNTAEIIDLNQPNPTWSFTGSMAYARRQMNATLLPTGDVLVTGGTSAGGFDNAAGAVLAAELWSPATGTWTTLASNAVVRMYHSTTLLLPDGRVLHTGSGDGANAPRELSYEIFSPPYLFLGARPSITGATPAVVGYGQTLFVGTPDAATIAKVTFIRLGTVTHAFDQSGRLVPLVFAPAAGGLSVTLPAARTTAPPGPYMLFLVNSQGVPSTSQIITLE